MHPGMHAIRAISAIALALALAACASPIGVRTADPQAVQRYLTRSALTTDEPSDLSLIELRRYDLIAEYAAEPAAAIARLHGHALASDLPAAALYALAELSFLRASRTSRHASSYCIRA